MTSLSTDSMPVIRRSGYIPEPSHPFTGPTSFVDRVAVAGETVSLAPAPPVRALDVVESRRVPYVAPVAAAPGVEGSDEGLRAPREKCKCGHPHGLHEMMRRGDRCTRCRCQEFEPKEHVLPATEEEAERDVLLWRVLAGCGLVLGGVVVGSVLTVGHLVQIGVLP